MGKIIISSLYENYKNTDKKLKIVCDWDEVIQACEPYALWLIKENENSTEEFSEYFKSFWDGWGSKKTSIEYSPYGSKLLTDDSLLKNNKEFKEAVERQQEIKNSPEFYQEASFLTIAEDLLKLIKEDKVEKLIFLFAYNKRKFPNGDERKFKIFKETFGKLLKQDGFCEKWSARLTKVCSLQLIPFDSETEGESKAEWIKEHAPDFDLFIDDNPNICKDVLNEFISFELCRNRRKENNFVRKEGIKIKTCAKWPKEFTTVCSPYYPATADQHDARVLLVKNEVSDLKREF